MTDESDATSLADDARRREVRRNWLLSTPALIVLAARRLGPAADRCSSTRS